ncbi:hypothetical protein [Natranaerobius thermophilus]|uniref:Uncharacterized protein n=1 Tax=Natranaerobius thermophilus (strain ATCC BAA-1301 / DSM 18059 / JW/NM-WN-LF) TaxID=457570 RepID=B2A7V7_NATTJ|nr:hypothetical protein [Natranaerobius thermophilus]ACB84405.1 conserved hypothetical protein [Natranaerobius thermophilus JW/NM-WN-LF]
MATKSILKNINIRRKSFCRNFINALENAKGRKSKEVKLSRPVTEIKGEKIKEIFGNER